MPRRIQSPRLRNTALVVGLSGAFAGGLALLPALQAGAVDSTSPSPCGELVLEDPAGDQSFDPSGLDLPQASTKTRDNTDLTAVFFNFRPDKDGKPVVTANLRVTKLDKTVPSKQDAQGGIYYYAAWKFGGKTVFVKAANADGTTITYGFGNIDAQGNYTTEGATKGAFFEGPNGVVQIDVPAALGGTEGATLGKVVAAIDYIQGANDQAGLNNHVDRAPGNASFINPNGQDYTATPCPGGGATTTSGDSTAGTTTGGTTTGSGGGTTTTGGSGGTTTSGSPGGTTTTSGGTTTTGGSTGGGTGGGSPRTASSLPFRASLFIGSAKKANKTRKLSFKIRADAAITGLKVELKNSKGKGPVLASATVKRVKKGIITVTLKLKTKKLKAGKYALIATGTSAGRRLRTAQQVGVKP